MSPILEEMSAFFNTRADTYEDHMANLRLDEFYEEIANLVVQDNIKLLDLGCGTGLEFEKLFAKFKYIRITGIDLSAKMLKILGDKYSDKNINLICGSYFDVDFGSGDFDIVLSTYSLHHFNEAKKSALYKKIFASLKPGGFYIEGDYTVKTQEEQDLYESELVRFMREQNLPDGFYHYDTPMTTANLIKLLKAEGFSDIKIIREWESTTIITAIKQAFSTCT